MAGADRDRHQINEIDGMAMPASFHTRMLVEPLGLAQGFRTILTGMERGRVLMLQLPRVQGLSDQLYADRTVKVRYVHEGHVFGFESTVLHHTVTPFRLLFLAYPKTTDRLNLRRNQRVDCFIPAGLVLPGSIAPDYRAMIVNISTSGCRVALDATGQRLPGFEVGGRVRLGFKVVGTDLDLDLDCQVKSVDADGARVYLGLNYVELDENGLMAVANYVDSVSCFLELC